MTQSTPVDGRLRALTTIACSVAPGASGLGRGFERFIAFSEAKGIGPVQKLYPASGDRQVAERARNVQAAAPRRPLPALDVGWFDFLE